MGWLGISGTILVGFGGICKIVFHTVLEVFGEVV